MNKILNCILIFLAFGCVNQRKDEVSITSQVEQNQDLSTIEFKSDAISPGSPFIDSSKFKFFNLQKFDIRDSSNEKTVLELPSPTKEKLFQYFQSARITEGNIYPSNYRYFSIQKNSNTEKIITIIEGDEICCSDLHLLIYNSKNKLISNNVVAGAGGDGMWWYESYGEFTNDSTYILTRIDMEEVELENGGPETHLDSVITTYRFYENKPFKKLTEQKFKTVENN